MRRKKNICLFISSSEINLHNLHWNGMIARMSLFSRLFCILSSIPCAHLFVACFISFYVWALWKKKQPNFVSFAICLRFIYLRFTQQTYHFANVCQPQWLLLTRLYSLSIHKPIMFDVDKCYAIDFLCVFVHSIESTFRISNCVFVNGNWRR